jgi:hypothetical protein
MSNEDALFYSVLAAKCGGLAVDKAYAALLIIS